MATHKKTIIKQIKNIIEKHGSFTTADVEADSSPVIASLGKHTFQLGETFDLHKVIAITYVNDIDNGDEDYISYEDLDRHVLAEILFLAEIHEAQEIQTEKRISN